MDSPAAAKIQKTSACVGERLPPVKFTKISVNATTPKKGTKYSAGHDLFSAYDYTLHAKSRKLVLTDIRIQMPRKCYGRIAPRSGLALNNGIDVLAGVIDQDYRGNIGIILINFGDETFNIKKGDRVAQLIFERIYNPKLFEVNDISGEGTARGSGAFGSTGLN